MGKQIDLFDQINSFLKDFNAGHIKNVEVQDNGYSDYVYKITTANDIFYVKQSKGEMKSFPSIARNKNDLLYEYKAYALVGKYLPAHALPRVLYFDPVEHYFIMTDAILGGSTTLKDVINDRCWPVSIAYLIGFYMGQLHGKSFVDQPRVRDGEKENEFFNKQLGWLTYEQNFFTPLLQEVVQERVFEIHCKPRVLVWGDLAPRNILVGNSNVAFVDLGNCVLGAPSYDVGFFVGHLLLKAIELNMMSSFCKFYESFIEGYKKTYTASGATSFLSLDEIIRDSHVFAAAWMQKRTFNALHPDDIPEAEVAIIKEYISSLVLVNELPCL